MCFPAITFPCNRTCDLSLFKGPPSHKFIVAQAALTSAWAALAAAGGSFNSLDPAAQALLQSVMAFVLEHDGLSAANPSLLQLVEQVPLLHAEDYRRLLQPHSGSGECANTLREAQNLCRGQCALVPLHIRTWSHCTMLSLMAEPLPVGCTAERVCLSTCLLQSPTLAPLSLPADTPDVFLKVWSAAVAAATDLQLAALPAFGAARPNMPWLVSLMEDLWLCGVGDMADEAGTPQTGASLPELLASAMLQQLKSKGLPESELRLLGVSMPGIGSGAQQEASADNPSLMRQRSLLESTVLLQPVLSAAARMLEQNHHQQQQQLEAAGSGRDALDAASQLLSAVCSLLSRKPPSDVPVSYTGVLQPAMQQLLVLLQEHKQVVDPPAHLLAALAAAVQAGAAAGDLSLLPVAPAAVQAATAAAGDLQLTQQDLGQLQWAAVAGAAAGAVSQAPAAADGAADAAAAPDSTVVAAAPDKEQLLALWSQALDTAPRSISSTSAGALVAALAQDAAAGGQLCQQLLQEQPPAAVLTQLLLSACTMNNTAGSAAVTQQLLAYTLQQGLLAGLKPHAVVVLLQYAVTDASPVPIDQVGSVLAVALQQGKVTITPAVARSLYQRLQESDASGYAAFAGHMMSLSGTPAAAAAQQLVCQLLCSADVAGGLPWQLFELLTELGPLEQVPQQQQLLQACGVLLLQQEAAARDRVVSVCQVACKAAGSIAAAVNALGSRSCECVLAGLVAAGQSGEALAVVQQQLSLQPQLAQLWQQQQQQQGAARDELLVQALQLCASDESAKAAAAADLLLQQLEACNAADALLQQAGLLQQLTQLLCQHARLTSLLQLLAATVQAVHTGHFLCCLQRWQLWPTAAHNRQVVMASSSSSSWCSC
jgi:hypothetical protein